MKNVAWYSRRYCSREQDAPTTKLLYNPYDIKLVKCRLGRGNETQHSTLRVLSHEESSTQATIPHFYCCGTGILPVMSYPMLGFVSQPNLRLFHHLYHVRLNTYH